MFGKTTKAKLEARFNKLLEESFKLSHTNRKASDDKAAQAEEVRKQLDALERDES